MTLFFKLGVLTILLTVLSYTGITLYTALSVFGITVSATYICYTLNTKLRLEKYLHHLPLGSLQKSVLKHQFDESDFQGMSGKRRYNGFNSFPKPIAKIFEKYIDSIVRDFIQSWYVYIGADEEDFIEEVRILLEQVVTELSFQLTIVDLHKLTADLIRMFQRHIATFVECQEIIERKYPNLHEDHFAPLISELYEEAVVKHMATRSKGAELDYLKTLVDILLHRFVPVQTFSCVSGRFLLREILAIQMLEPLIKDVTDAHFVNEIVVDILEPSVPLAVILENWDKAMKEIEDEEEGEQVILQPPPECDISSPETNYESTHEITQEIKTSPSRKHSRRSKKKARKRIFQVTGNSSSDHSDNEQPTKDIIRFDKLDTRTSNPVYGSTSARDHEKSTQLLSPVDKTLDVTMEPIDSGRSSLGNPSNRLNMEASGNFHDASIIDKQDWTVCPRPEAAVFQQPSFSEMPLNQDDLTERLKAKVNSADLTNIVRSSIACLDTCSPRRIAEHEDVNVPERPHTKSTRTSRVLSIDGSVTMNFSSRKTSNMKKEYEEKGEQTLDTDMNNKSDSCVKVHASGTDGAFYVIAPSCPTCIEMTLLASPFEIEKAQIVLNEKERAENDKIIEHECGLSSEHFCNPQAETESINVEPLIESQLVVSCSDGTISDNSISSGTLLASGETFEDSRATDTERSSSFDNITDVSFHSSACDVRYDDENTTLSCDDEVATLKKNKKRAKRPKQRKVSRAASYATFKTAIEDSVIDETTRRRSTSTNSLERNKNIFVKLFKKARHNKKISAAKAEGGGDGGGQSSVSDENVVHKKRNKHQKRRKKIEDELKVDTSSISTSVTKFNSLPENPSSGPSHWNSKHASYMKDLVEEVGYELDEDEGLSSGNLTLITQVDPLSKEITVTDKDLMDVKSVKSQEGTTPSIQSCVQQQQQDPNKFIPIYEGQVIMPHPSKLPATWLYPIQMISIPSTEVALEKGWEPGINKYTLYGIHYDIRIWPDQYQKQLKEATMQPKITGEENNAAPETVPLIREIKRRYREFLYLHNRLTHGPLSKHMKGILRPNRRYAMPFGRMDPDVIEGRRKILETYMVSLVSRPELCNSREFKEFLGSEDYDNASHPKATKIGQKNLYQNHAKNIITTEPKPIGEQVTKETVERMTPGLNSQYFIHGYDVPRMFGYSLDDDIRKHSKLILSHFVLNYHTFKRDVIPKFEAFQKPQIHKHTPHKEIIHVYDTTTRVNTSASDPTFFLGPRTDGDGAETAEQSRKDGTSNRNSMVFDDASSRSVDNKKLESSINQSIAAKFSEELASRLQEEKEHLASRIAHEKDLYESSWPLTDSVLSIVSQILKGYGSWLTFEKVQQAILFSLGGIIEWLIGRELDEAVMQERCFKYLTDLYYIVWDKQDNLKPKKPEPTIEEKLMMKERVVQRVMDFIPSFIRVSIGNSAYQNCCSNLVKSLQYQQINRHLLYAALEIILQDVIPETRCDHPSYVTLQENSSNS